MDIGCGTGAFSKAFSHFGYNIRGIDIAPNMVEAARSSEIDCSLADIVQGLHYTDKHFDFVVSAFVAHGLPGRLRTELFMEAKRLSKELVIFHDYNSKRNLITDVVERLEGGDYFHFIQHGLEEMKRIFPFVDVLPATKNANWYVCGTE